MCNYRYTWWWFKAEERRYKSRGLQGRQYRYLSALLFIAAGTAGEAEVEE